MGNNSVVAEANGTVVQKTHYYPFRMAFAESMGEKEQPYKYNGKELDRRLQLNTYDYVARYMDPAIGRFTSIDPHAENYYSISPYAYVANNPINAVDPTGMDSIRVNGQGVATGVYKNDGNNRFFDSNGRELFFHDIADIDDVMLYTKFKVDDHIYMPLSEKQVLQQINSAYLSNALISLGNATGPSYVTHFLTVRASHSTSDFSQDFLLPYARKNGTGLSNLGKSSGDGENRARTLDEPNFAFFRIGNSNTIYNLYDAGNFMWGAWGNSVGYPYTILQTGSQANEWFMDSKADQQAIKNGFNWLNTTRKR